MDANTSTKATDLIEAPVRTFAALTLLLSVLSAFALSCQRPGALPDENDLETVDVDLGPTASLTPEGDAVEENLSNDQSGALPGNFPSDLPIYLPATVVDFGAVDDSRSYVVLTTDDPRDRVETELRRKLERSPWTSTAGGSGSFDRSKGPLRAIFRLAVRGQQTEIRVEYGLR